MAQYVWPNLPDSTCRSNSPASTTHIHTVREKAGDVSHMGEIQSKAPGDRLSCSMSLEQRSHAVRRKIQYSCLPNGRGIVDDILVYRIDAETFLLVVNASNTERTGNTSAKRW